MYSQPDVLPAAPRATEQQRLTATLVLSTLVHGLLILGVGFAVSDNAPLVPRNWPNSLSLLDSR